MKHPTKAGLLALLLLAGLFALSYSNTQHWQDDYDISATSTVSNKGLSIKLLFLSPKKIQEWMLTWTPTHQQAYINAAQTWLNAITGVDGAIHHTITIRIAVSKLENANGEAGPDELADYANYSFPVSGEVLIGQHTYAPGFDQQEFHANILHEIGHVLGFGTLTQPYVSYDENSEGYVFYKQNSKAVALYQQLYNTHVNFVPFSEDQGHLYDHVLSEDAKRVSKTAGEIPALSDEVMANGYILGPISLAILDDIGYNVDYSKLPQSTISQAYL